MNSIKLAPILLILFTFIAITAAVAGADEDLPDGFKSNMPDNKDPVAEGGLYNNSSSIQFKESSVMSQSPSEISVGTGYYQSHQIGYGPLMSSQTSIKNERTGTSMNHDIDNAHSIDGSLTINAHDSTARRYDPDPQWSGRSSTQMMIDENVVEGQVHIGALQGSDNSYNDQSDLKSYPSLTTIKDPALEIDEDYVGTFHIEKNLSIEIPTIRIQRDDSWLQYCCNTGGLSYIEKGLRRISPDSIFDYRSSAAMQIIGS